MTDTLPDADLLSTTEIVPTAPEPVKAPGGQFIHECPDCGAKANKVGVPFFTKSQMGTHRANSHGYRAPGAVPKPSPPRKPTAEAKPGPAPKAPTIPKPAPKSAPARKPLGEQIARLVLQVGRIINQVEPPTGAAIMFEAGAMGAAIDSAIAGTFIDKPLQKVSATTSKIEPLVPLITLPAMIFMATRDEHLGKLLESEIREALEDVLAQSLPLLKKRAARTRETVEALGELEVIDPELKNAADPIGMLLDRMFAGYNPGDVEPDAEG